MTLALSEPQIPDSFGSASANKPPSVTASFFEPEYAEVHDRRILIVDDEEVVRTLHASWLGETYSCTTASNAQEALAILSRESFALVLSDIQMPGLGGVELLRKIVQLYPDTATIIVSGVDRTQRVIDAIREGAFDYLIKPCDLDVLMLCVERALERRLLLRNARRYKRDLERRNVELARQKAELVRLQARILHAEKMASLGLLAAGVAHELNNPAGYIYSNVDVLKTHMSRLKECLLAYDGLSLPPAVARKIAAIKEKINYQYIVDDLDSILSDCYLGAERIRDVVQNLRLFSRLDEAEIKRIDLNEGIEATVRLLSRYYKAGKIVVHCEYGELPLVNCYAAQLNQVWMNLLVNAAQAIAGAEGRVWIKTEHEGDWIRVSITDSGRGIAPEHLHKVFDPFFTTKPVGEGTGLGLSISHGIIHRHGGTIAVDNVADQGTRFTIRLPVDAERSTAANKETEDDI